MSDTLASVLIVDDESDVCELMSAVLERHQYEVITARSGAEALGVLETRVVDLVVLDLLMPDVSGVEILARIRAKYSLNDLPVVILTAHASMDHLQQALEIGANDFLVKPLSMSLILGRLEVQMQMKRNLDKLKDASIKARETLNALPDLVFRANPAGVLRDASMGPQGLPWMRALHTGGNISEGVPENLQEAFMEFSGTRREVGEVECRRCPYMFEEKELIYEMRMVACSGADTVCIVRDVTEQAAFEKQLLQLARTDALTQIANRRVFDEVILTEWRRASRHNAPLSLIMLDVDHFKLYNDSLGHPAGDECLRLVAKAISKALLRAGDFVARYGGEEFTIVVPDTDLGGSMKVAERVQAELVRLAIPHPKSPFGVLTLSIGIACCIPSRELELPHLVRSADEALYDAKRNGRNKIETRNYAGPNFNCLEN